MINKNLNWHRKHMARMKRRKARAKHLAFTKIQANRGRRDAFAQAKVIRRQNDVMRAMWENTFFLKRWLIIAYRFSVLRIKSFGIKITRLFTLKKTYAPQIKT